MGSGTGSWMLRAGTDLLRGARTSLLSIKGAGTSLVRGAGTGLLAAVVPIDTYHEGSGRQAACCGAAVLQAARMDCGEVC